MSDLFKDYGNRIAAIDDKGEKITYREMQLFSSKIKELIGKRCLVFSLCTNSIGALVGYIAFQKNDIVPLLLTNKLDDELLEYLLELYKPEYLWAPKDSRFEEKRYVAIWEEYGYVLYKTNYNSFPLAPELALLLTTSGSTGSPKLVRQSYKNLEANTKSIIEYLKIEEDERTITTLPMNYTYGLSIINTHLHVGATVLLTEKTILQKEFWEFFKETGATSFGGVPYTYEMLDKLRFFRMDLPSLRYMTQAGGKLSPELHKKFAQYALNNGKKFVVMYGQTEATARMAYLPHDKSIEKYGSMGIAIPGGEFQLIDIEGNEITEPYITGELVYRGENVTLGYAEKGEDLVRGDERKGVLVTGDMAQKDADGYFYIVGRKKRFLKIFGNRVNLDETEGLLKEEFKDCECACSGVDDKMYIFINNDVYLNDVKRYISEKTKLHTSAFKVMVIPEIPKNNSGKTLYSKLNQYLERN